MMRLRTFNIQRCRFLKERELERIVAAILKAAHISSAELSITFATDKEIKPLNKLYRRNDRPTDVLSFAMREGYRLKKDECILGDIVISVDRAREQAKEFGTSFEEEMQLYIIHGVLHLLGYDDEEPVTEKKMRKKEKEFMQLWQRRNS